MLQEGSSFRLRGGSAAKAKTRRFPFRVWLLSLSISTLAVAAAFVYFDVPIARRVSGVLATESLEKGFASAILLGIESAVAFALMIVRITRGRLSPLGEATMLACLTSICSYGINENTLKFFFGVPNPAAVLRGTQHAFHLLKGSSTSSFPSGHMVLASSFAAVFMRLYRTSILPFSVLLLIAAALLIAGDWHFVSDVIAGTSIGITAGFLAAEVWLAHSS